MASTYKSVNKISTEVRSCIRAFEGLLGSINQTGAFTQAAADETKKRFGDQNDRFELWVGNIGAHKQGQSSLDFRLRDAAHIKDAVVIIVIRLRDMLAESVC